MKGITGFKEWRKEPWVTCTNYWQCVLYMTSPAQLYDIHLKERICNAPVSTSIFTENSTQYQKRQFVSIFVVIFMSFVSSRISTIHLHLDCVNYVSMWLATQARLLNLQYSFKFLFFLWIFNAVSGNSNKATVTKARCYANCLTRVSHLSIETISITFTSNGKREFVPRDQVSPWLVVYYCSLFLHIN